MFCGFVGFGCICIVGVDVCLFLFKEVLMWDKLLGIRSRCGWE